MLLLSAKEGAFERPKALMGFRQLPGRGQLRVGDAHHFRGRHPEGGREERPQAFAVVALAFWVGRPWKRCLRDSRSWSRWPGWERGVHITLSDTCFDLDINLEIVVVVDTGTCGHAFVVGVVRAREFAVELKL